MKENCDYKKENCKCMDEEDERQVFVVYHFTTMSYSLVCAFFMFKFFKHIMEYCKPQ